jgi:hypothetical protein
MQVATNIAGILFKNDLKEVKGKIEEVWCIRQIDDDIVAEGDHDNDYGPLAMKSSRVFKIKLVDNDNNIYVFFYDTWADHCKFLIENDSISLTSSSQITYKNILKSSQSNNEHKCVIAITPSLASTEINQVILRMNSSKLLHDQFTLTSESLAQVKIELKKRGNSTKNDKKSLLNTSSSSASSLLNIKTTRDSIGINTNNTNNNSGTINESHESLKHIGPVLKKVKSGTYVYTKIADLKIPNRGEMYRNTVNVVGIVVFYGRPKLCKSGKNKYTCSYTIIDSTSKSICEGVVVNVFENNINFFPKIIAIGDVLRIHRVGIDSYQSKIQLIGNPPAHTSLATFRPKMSLLTGLVPIHNEEIEINNENNKNKKTHKREIKQLFKNNFTDFEVKSNSTTRSGKNFETKNKEELLIEESENEEFLLKTNREYNSKNGFNSNNLLYNDWECNSGTEYNASYESSENENNSSEFYSCLRILMRDQLGSDPEILPLNLDSIYLQWYSQLIQQQRNNCIAGGFHPTPVSCTSTSPSQESSITKIQELYTGNRRDSSPQPILKTSFDLICMLVSVTKTVGANREENTVYEVWDGSLGGELYRIIPQGGVNVNCKKYIFQFIYFTNIS